MSRYPTCDAMSRWEDVLEELQGERDRLRAEVEAMRVVVESARNLNRAWLRFQDEKDAHGDLHEALAALDALPKEGGGA